jgi:ring-1,2-phenylacetyl-CoA epoxidase subunit PaaE
LNLSTFLNAIKGQTMSATFARLTIAEVLQETADAISVVFDVPEGDNTFLDFKPGQHLTLRAEIAGEDVRRNYSLCVAPHEKLAKVAIKRIQGGVFSNWAAENLKSGATLDVMPPHGSFTIEFNAAQKAHYVGFAGGSGITPVLSLLKAALVEEPNSSFTLFYGNRDSNAVLFLEEIAQLKDRYLDRFTLVNILSDEDDEIALFNGLLDRSKCEALCDTLENLDDIRAFFICGPGPMMDAAEAVLTSRNVQHDRILVERFTAGRPSASQAAAFAAQSEKAAGTAMKISLDGRTRNVSFDAASGNILDSARASGFSAPYACKAGVCATCRAKLVSGKVRMAARYGLSDEEVAAGYILTCQAIPDGNEAIIVDFDQ